jgi:hypothetical protein
MDDDDATACSVFPTSTGVNPSIAIQAIAA